MKKQCLFVCFLSLFSFKLLAQSSSQQLTKIVPPSPNASAIQRFGDIPVSAYTGVPSITIPLYEIKAGNVSVPISLNYHASGIKVADEASRVGLGWILDAGGVISRTVVGDDDFNANQAYHFSSSKPEVASGIKDFGTPSFIIQKGCDITVPNMPNLYDDINEGYSFQPDVYSFNFLGFVGKFFLKRNKDVILAKKEKIDIRCMDDDANSWEVTTSDGNKFLFEEFETYGELGAAPNSYFTHKSAWYITKILTQTGESISFQYTTSSNYIKPAGSVFESNNPSSFPVDLNQGSAGSFPSIKTISAGKQYKNVYLNKIVFKAGEVQFNYSSDRIDIENDLRLSTVQIYANSPSGSLTLMKQWSLQQGYFEGTSSGYASSTGNISKRLKLDRLIEMDAQLNQHPPFEFTYNNDDGYPNTLPTKTSYSRDHWGYYNGKNNTSLIPDYHPGNVPNNPVLSAIGVEQDNRNTDPLYAQLFSLHQIKYPTGGRTVFEYESNDYDIATSMVNDRSELGGTNEAVPKEVNEEYTNPTGELPLPADVPSKLMDLTDLYVPAGQTTARVELVAFFRINGLPEGCNIGENIHMALLREDGAIMGESHLTSHLGRTSNPITTCDGPPGQLVGMSFLQDYFLSPGKYYWRIRIVSGYTSVLDAKVKMKYNGLKIEQPIVYNNETLIGAFFAGGLRIKRILDYDNVTSIPMVKRYDYHYKDQLGNRHSYGRRMARPMYSYFDDAWGSVSINDATNFYRFEHLIRESDSNIPLNGSRGGSAVGYDKVTVYYGENGENGKTEFEFENITDVIWDYNEESYINGVYVKAPRKYPAFSGYQNPTNGNIKTQVDYQNKNGSFYEVKKIENTYDELLGSSSPLWYGIEKRGYNGYNMASCPIRILIYPTLVEGRKLLSSSTTTLSGISQTVTYAYNNSSHLQLISSKQKSSKGDEITTSYTYPLDYMNIDADLAIQQMKGDKFMHGNVITISTNIVKEGSSSSILINSVINKYQASDIDIAASKITLKEIAALETNSGIVTPIYQPSSNQYPLGYHPKRKFDEYDAFGNILQMHKTDDILQSYIWGYNSSYPVASVVNASNSDIAYTSFEANDYGNWNNYTGMITSVSVPHFPPTGKKYYNLTSGTTLSKTVVNGKKYIISYWSNSTTGYTIAGGTTEYGVGKTINGWTYHKHTVSATSTTLTITGTGSIDEVRLYPENAQMVTYTYEPLQGISSQCDINNKIIYYEYDGFQRLKTIKDEDGNILKYHDYQYHQ